MKKSFESYSEAIQFAQTEAKKLGKKTYVFLVRKTGIQYVVTDTENFKSVVGKLRKEYGQDPVSRPIEPPKEEVKHSFGTVISAPEKTEVSEDVAEVVTDRVKEEDIVAESTPAKPKKTRKKKSDE